MMEILEDPEDSEYESVMDWTGGYEDREFDQLYINARLLKEF